MLQERVGAYIEGQSQINGHVVHVAQHPRRSNVVAKKELCLDVYIKRLLRRWYSICIHLKKILKCYQCGKIVLLLF
ncbi:hypothetical protein L1887_09059 [Cichorium endivia]|nr:hypothetical protein L1887_09059 [Cichorium endivia]